MSQAPRAAEAASILDRLVASADEREGETIALSVLREGLRRDLEGVLNTRRRFLSPPGELDELGHSLLAYGLTDFTNAPLRSGAFRQAFVAEVRSALQRLEPRIRDFEVTIQDSDEVGDRILRFRIVGFVRFGGATSQIRFDSHVDPVRCVIVRD